MDKLYPNEVRDIKQIIDTTRLQEEGLLVDSKQAAIRIMQYLTDKNKIDGKEVHY